MTRSPLAYPLNRSADLDIGGAADLQTDIMRQSIPLTPIEPLSVEEMPVVPTPDAVVEAAPQPDPVIEPPRAAQPQPESPPVEQAVVLTRPKWQPRYVPVEKPVASADPIVKAPSPVPPTEPQEKGFPSHRKKDSHCVLPRMRH
jgi:hypothetical protein